MGEYISGLTPTQALATLRDALFESFELYFLSLRGRSQGQISTRMAAEISVEMVVGSFKPIYEQFDPMRLGENERSVQIARAYGQRIKTKNVKDDSIEKLVNGYPSHGFVIDRDEAGELFREVRAPSKVELSIAKVLRSVSEQALIADVPIIRCLEVGEPEDEDEETNDGNDSETNSNPNAEKIDGSTAASDTDSSGEGGPGSSSETAGGSGD